MAQFTEHKTQICVLHGRRINSWNNDYSWIFGGIFNNEDKGEVHLKYTYSLKSYTGFECNHNNNNNNDIMTSKTPVYLKKLS